MAEQGKLKGRFPVNGSDPPSLWLDRLAELWRAGGAGPYRDFVNVKVNESWKPR